MMVYDESPQLIEDVDTLLNWLAAKFIDSLIVNTVPRWVGWIVCTKRVLEKS